MTADVTNGLRRALRRARDGVALDATEAEILLGARGDALTDLCGSAARVRDQGHVFHVEAFVVPRRGMMPTLDQLPDARDACIDLDWKIQDIVLVPIDELPEEVGGSDRSRQSERNR